MWYRVELLVRTNADDETLREIEMLANTYAIIETVHVARSPDGESRVTARLDAPSAESALGTVLTVVDQVSGEAGLINASSLRGVVLERDERGGGGL
jgi:hypothetical protein